MLELSEVETGELSDLLEAVDQRVSVYEELSRGLGDVEVVLEEALDGHEGLAVEALEAALLEDLLEEHLAEGGRQLIDKSADAEVLVADDILLGVEDLADLNRDLSLLEGAREVLDAVDSGTDTDRDLSVELA